MEKVCICGLAYVLRDRKSQNRKVSHLRKVRKSNKLSPQIYRFAILRNLFADCPPKYKPTKQYSLLRKCADKIGKGQFLLAAKTVRRNKFQVVTLMTSNLSLHSAGCERYEIKVVEGGMADKTHYRRFLG